MTIMTIIAAVFTLVNINVGFVGQAAASHVVSINLATIGSFALLAGLIALPLQPKSAYARVVPWVLAIVAFVASVLLF